MTPKGLLDRLRRLDLDKVVHDAVEGEKSAMVELNRDQLRNGLAPDGARIGQYSSISYARLKQSMNPSPGFRNVDLIYTGNFINDFVAEVSQTEVDLFSRDSKMDMLDEKYPGRIFGLTKESRSKFVTIFYNRFKQHVTTITGLTFK